MNRIATATPGPQKRSESSREVYTWKQEWFTPEGNDGNDLPVKLMGWVKTLQEEEFGHSIRFGNEDSLPLEDFRISSVKVEEVKENTELQKAFDVTKSEFSGALDSDKDKGQISGLGVS